MPFIVPFIPLIAAGVTAGTQIGLTLSQGGGGGSSLPTTPTTTPQSPTTNAAQKASVASALPNLQSLTGGSLSPEYAAQFGASQAGLSNNPQAAGNVQAAINQFFGLNAPGESGLQPGGGNVGKTILDTLSQSRQPSTGTGGNVSEQILADEFHGFA